MSDLKKKLEALLALQEEYIQLVEEENPECSETAAYYTELLEELKKSVRKNSMKYARTIIQNEYFQKCLMTHNGRDKDKLFCESFQAPEKGPALQP